MQLRVSIADNSPHLQFPGLGLGLGCVNTSLCTLKVQCYVERSTTEKQRTKYILPNFFTQFAFTRLDVLDLKGVIQFIRLMHVIQHAICHTSLYASAKVKNT